MYLALIILPLLGSIASGLARSTPGFSSSTPSRDIRNKQRVPKKLLHSNANGKGYYYTGFFDAEGCFFVSVLKSISCKLGTSVSLEFNITQHCRDEALMKGLINFFGCGRIKSDSRSPSLYFVVTKFTDIITKILPFFDKYSLQSVKCLDYADFCKVAEIMKVKGHLTPKGLEQVRDIKAGMNNGRIFLNKYGLRGTEKFVRKKMYLALILLPLLGSIASGLFGRKLGVTGSQLITTSLVIITTFLAIIAYLEVGLNSIPVSIQLFK
jgi:hypothetical protein